MINSARERCTSCQALVLRQVKLPGADLGRPKSFMRFAKMPGEPVDLFDVADHAARVLNTIMADDKLIKKTSRECTWISMTPLLV